MYLGGYEPPSLQKHLNKCRKISPSSKAQNAECISNVFESLKSVKAYSSYVRAKKKSVAGSATYTQTRTVY